MQGRLGVVVSRLETIMRLLLVEGRRRGEEDGQPVGHGVCLHVLRDSRGREGEREGERERGSRHRKEGL